MNPLRLVIRSLLHFRKRNAILALGFAISTAVLTGALIVGDSVKYSLNSIVEKRLGEVTLVMTSGDRFITEELTSKLRETLNTKLAGLLKVEGIAIVDGGQKRLDQISILGVDGEFDKMGSLRDYYKGLSGDSVIISENLSERLGIFIGDEFLLRMTKASLVPLNAPFVSDAENTVSLRVVVKSIATTAELGAFNLKTSQTAPFNIFISADRLRAIMDMENYSNLLLIADEEISHEELLAGINENWMPQDAGLDLKFDKQFQVFDIKTKRVFIDDVIASTLKAGFRDGIPYLSYFVNSLSSNEYSTPYSFISTLPGQDLSDNEIIVNQWLATDLQLRTGDSLELSYFVVGPLRELEVENATFIVKSIVPLEGIYADKQLMPEIPGMSDAGNCRDWETGVPIELESIRDKDEDYWTQYKGTPKAFISLSKAEKIWSNRFGTYTSFRIPGVKEDADKIRKSIMENLDPLDLGFKITPVKDNGKYAAENGVDFSELFGGLSFFLLLGAIILSILLIKLNLDERKEQVRTLSELGIPYKKIRWILMNEINLVARLGGLIGLLLAILYNRMIFHALNTIWVDIVRTDMLSVNIKVVSLLIGYVISIIVAWIAVFFSLNSFLKKMVSSHIRQKEKNKWRNSSLFYTLISALSGLASISIIGIQLARNETVNSSLFFVAGFLLLLSGISGVYRLAIWLKSRQVDAFDFKSLSTNNALSNLPRSMSIIILLAMGTFIVISTGSNRKDLFSNAGKMSSGTGGFLYFAESTVPQLQNLNNPEVRTSYDLSNNYDIIQMRIADGDDASCLNLNKISNPRIIGINPSKLNGRFSFETSIDLLDKSDPWSSLSADIQGDLIPAIADETVIKWGLGMNVGDTLFYKDAMGKELKLLLMGGLAPSIFQGNVIISEKQFLKHFPASSGTEVFLVDGAVSDTTSIRDELIPAMRDFGWSMEYAPARLAKFNSITNTYLSIFMILGALGLLLGTVGMAIVLFRSVLERKKEFSLLRAVGVSVSVVKSMVIREYAFLFVGGTLIGLISSLVATLPSFLSSNTGASILLVAAIVIVLLLNGFFWIWLLSSISLKNISINYSLRNE